MLCAYCSLSRGGWTVGGVGGGGVGGLHSRPARRALGRADDQPRSAPLLSPGGVIGVAGQFGSDSLTSFQRFVKGLFCLLLFSSSAHPRACH